MNLLFIIIQIKRRIESSFFWRYGRWQFKHCHIIYGKDLMVNGRMILDISPKAEVRIGDGCFFKSGRGINPLASNIKGVIKVHDNASVVIGNHCGFSSPVINIRHSLTMGDYVQVGAHVIFLDSDSHSLNYMDRRDADMDDRNKKSKAIVIGDDVLIGANSMVLKGVTIGSRSVIGAGSVVTRNIPDDVIAAGNPAKVIKILRERNDD